MELQNRRPLLLINKSIRILTFAITFTFFPLHMLSALEHSPYSIRAKLYFINIVKRYFRLVFQQNEPFVFI